MLIATDLSPYSEEMVDCGSQLQDFGCCRVTLVYVKEDPFAVRLAEAVAHAHSPDLERQAAKLRARGYDVSVIVRKGSPWFEILEEVRTSAPDLVVVGSHGRGAMAASPLGGTASHILERCAVPVLFLRMSLPESGDVRQCSLLHTRALDHVLLPTDFSPAASRAADMLKGLGDRVSRITLLHVYQSKGWAPIFPDAPESIQDEGHEHLDKIAKDLTAAGCRDVAVELDRGDPKEVIFERSGADGVTLVVMGCRGWRVQKDLMVGSVSYTLVRLAPVPVLLVRP